MDDSDLKTAHQAEVLDDLQNTAAQHLSLLTPIADAWQPTDFLPNFSCKNWPDDLDALRAEASRLNSDLLVVLVGGMITEEALPNYSVSLNNIARDYQGASEKPWAMWLRGWTAEENRHGDLLNAYLRLCGLVDMRTVELTVNHLLAAGFAAKEAGPYSGLIYASFQERATRISHGNIGSIATKEGADVLGRICRRIAGDEARHEKFYTTITNELFAVDPDGAMIAFNTMLRTTLAMPGRLMYDGHDPKLFDHYAIVAQRLGVYTVFDYAAIIRHLVNAWDIPGRSVSGFAARAQERILKQAARFQAMAEVVAGTLAIQPKVRFAWIHDQLA